MRAEVRSLAANGFEIQIEQGLFIEKWYESNLCLCMTECQSKWARRDTMSSP